MENTQKIDDEKYLVQSDPSDLQNRGQSEAINNQIQISNEAIVSPQYSQPTPQESVFINTQRNDKYNQTDQLVQNRGALDQQRVPQMHKTNITPMFA